MAKRVLVKDLQKEIKEIKECWDYDVETLQDVAGELEAATLKIENLEQDIRLASYRIEDLTTGYDSRGSERDRLKEENTRLVKKNEAMQSIIDTIAHAATAGQSLIEL